MSELRQWTHIRTLAAASVTPPFIGAVLLGSFARGEADDLSDVDFVVFAAEGSFDRAWRSRHSLHCENAYCWDYERPPGDRDVAAHRWLTRDFVLFDGLLATPSGTRIADPVELLAGGEALARQLEKREPIAADERERRKDELVLHPVERLYGELKLALRAQR